MKIPWGCRILIENALGLRNSVKKLGDPDAPRGTLAGAMGQGVINKNRAGKILVENNYDGGSPS